MGRNQLKFSSSCLFPLGKFIFLAFIKQYKEIYKNLINNELTPLPPKNEQGNINYSSSS